MPSLSQLPPPESKRHWAVKMSGKPFSFSSNQIAILDWKETIMTVKDVWNDLSVRKRGGAVAVGLRISYPDAYDLPKETRRFLMRVAPLLHLAEPFYTTKPVDGAILRRPLPFAESTTS